MRKVALSIERSGMTVHFGELQTNKLAESIADVLDQFRILEQLYPEMIRVSDPIQIGGYSPVDVPEDYWEDKPPDPPQSRVRVGF